MGGGGLCSHSVGTLAGLKPLKNSLGAPQAVDTSTSWYGWYLQGCGGAGAGVGLAQAWHWVPSMDRVIWGWGGAGA